MPAISITLEVDSPGQEQLLRQYHAFLQEMERLALEAPAGRVLSVCEAAVLEKGQEANRRVLEEAVQKRIDAAEKKGRRSGRVAAADDGKTGASPAARS